MKEPNATHEKAQSFFEDLWKRGDPWELETSEFEQAKYADEISILAGRRYGRALEIGCGIGSFTRLLTGPCDSILALDISPTAIARAHERGLHAVEFREQNIMHFDLERERPWDLIVLNETIYYLGWLYSFFDVAWLATQLFDATATSGRLLMANTCGGLTNYLLRPPIIRTYHDLFVNVGYKTTAESTFRGVKNGVEIETLISVFSKLPA